VVVDEDGLDPEYLLGLLGGLVYFIGEHKEPIQQSHLSVSAGIIIVAAAVAMGVLVAFCSEALGSHFLLLVATFRRGVLLEASRCHAVVASILRHMLCDGAGALAGGDPPKVRDDSRGDEDLLHDAVTTAANSCGMSVAATRMAWTMTLKTSTPQKNLRYGTSPASSMPARGEFPAIDAWDSLSSLRAERTRFYMRRD
jgi:hypothetical protein